MVQDNNKTFDENDKKFERFTLCVYAILIISLILAVVGGIILCFFNLITGIVCIVVGLLVCAIFYIFSSFLISIASDVKAVRNKVYNIEKSIEINNVVTGINTNNTDNIDKKTAVKQLLFKLDLGEISQEEFQQEVEKLKSRN